MELVTRSRKRAANLPPLSVSEDDLQNSEEEEEEDNFAGADLVEDAPGDVRASASVTPDQDVPSDSVENHATMEGTIEPSDEIESAEEVGAEYDGAEQSEDIVEHNLPTRPQRQRRPPPQILTYNSLGNPQYQRVEPCSSEQSIFNSTQVPWMTPAAAAVGAPLYY